jgi:hypothetical protein
MQIGILGTVLSKHWIVNIKSSTLPGCVCPVQIPWGWDIWLFPKISFERFFLESCREYCFDPVSGVQTLGFKKKTRSSGKIKPIHPGSMVTVVLVHCNMGINMGTDG